MFVVVVVDVRVFESDDESLLEKSRWKSLSRKLVVGNEDERTGTVQDQSYIEMQRVRSEDGSAAVKKNRVEEGGWVEQDYCGRRGIDFMNRIEAFDNGSPLCVKKGSSLLLVIRHKGE